MNFKKTALIIGMSAALVGCESLTQNQRTAVGAGVGAVVGGLVGNQVADGRGAAVGAVVGALAGGAIGRYMTETQQNLEQELANTGITVTRVNDSTIKLNIPTGLLFQTAKYDLNAGAMNNLAKIAGVLNKFQKTALNVEGHADSRGDAGYNLNLSQNRANSVANYLMGQGIINQRIIARGHGESYPVASNADEIGRAQNRRVEIYVRAIEQGNEQAAFAPIYY